MTDGVTLSDFDAVRDLVAPASRGRPRPFTVGIDGRSSSGKSTLADRLAASEPACTVVHTDDVAWGHSRFGWDDLLIENVLRPARRGEPVAYCPEAWRANGRAGSIDVPADTALLLVEGVGVGRRSLAPYLDALIWVETPDSVTAARNATRIGLPGGPQSAEHLRDWLAEENPLLDAERPWERADLVVSRAPTR